MPFGEGPPCWSVAALLAVLPACSNQTDVVAQDGPLTDGGSITDSGNVPYSDVALIENCNPGRYRGMFFSSPEADGAPAPIPLSGTMWFTLVLSQSGEFLTLDPESHLEGSWEGTNGAFSADVVGDQSCQSGAFKTTFEHGIYTIGMFASNFGGGATGNYSVKEAAFYGEWHVELPGANPIRGTWIALWCPPESASACAAPK